MRVKDGVIEHQQDKIYELAFSYAEGKGQVIFRACDHPWFELIVLLVSVYILLFMLVFKESVLVGAELHCTTLNVLVPFVFPMVTVDIKTASVEMAKPSLT